MLGEKAAGALAVSAQNRHLLGKVEGLGYFILRWSRMMDLWAGNARKHTGLDGLGLKTIATLFGSAEARIRWKP